MAQFKEQILNCLKNIIIMDKYLVAFYNVINSCIVNNNKRNIILRKVLHTLLYCIMALLAVFVHLNTSPQYCF